MPFAPTDPALSSRVTTLGQQLFQAMDAAPVPGVFSRKGAYARAMEWAMADPAFKTQLFRFVDVLPALTSAADVVRHLQEYLGDRAVALHPALKAGLSVAGLAPALAAGPVKANVAAMARQFVAGATPEDLMARIRANTAAGIATTIDLLGETVVSAAEADVFLQRNLAVLDTVSAFLAREPQPGFSDLGAGGPLPRLNLSVKISALTPEVHPADPAKSLAALRPRLRTILRRAREVGALVNFDMESYQLKDLTLALFRSMLEEPEFQSAPAAGIALQAYLRDTEADLAALVAWARQRGRPISVRLVKGAYWDYEVVLARQRGWPVPVWEQKAETDAAFERLSALLLDDAALITPNFATHNVRSVAHAIAQAERRGLDPRAYEFQALFGMADELKAALARQGHRVREYCAIGELLPGMAYLVRRLLENTSNEGFVRRRQTGEASVDELLRDPATLIRPAPAAKEAPAGRFRNAPNTDFTRGESRRRLEQALADATAGRRHPLVIGGRRVADREYLPSVNPAHPNQVVGSWARATADDAAAAIAAARTAQPAWSRQPATSRIALLEQLADRMEARRHQLSALEILEAGKPWLEADADVSEAIDFCRFYAAEMRRLEAPAVTQPVPGERCTLRWVPRGTGVVIAPWNFPLAILCGMTVAPLVGGNTVVIKPAEQTSVLGATFMELLEEAGCPPGVVNLLTGIGEEVGPLLVSHPGVDFIAFTGSRAVGLNIWETAARPVPGQRNLKKVVCEMGGKNALIVDTDADLDEAIPAILGSAFGFAGQKCSALSRLIVLAGVYDRLVERLLAAAAAVPMGDPVSPGTVVGPVIDEEARRRILRLIAQAQPEARLAWQAPLPPELAGTEGYYVPPTIFTEVPPTAAIAREEIFGPVLAVLKVRDLDEAFAVANATDYALTGGIFSRSPRALERAERELECGNLYLNRGITGAIVERHPFGGYRMSGAGTKAGGRGYLENFLFPRAIAENVLRRGFAPPEEGE
jgi:RHH-type proline utilization regulon transcriptional repressor/proline dehydrogenase/delta 1-pyrroline-5-carboxylate dehydrogenase